MYLNKIQQTTISVFYIGNNKNILKLPNKLNLKKIKLFYYLYVAISHLMSTYIFKNKN